MPFLVLQDQDTILQLTFAVFAEAGDSRGARCLLTVLYTPSVGCIPACRLR